VLRQATYVCVCHPARRAYHVTRHVQPRDFYMRARVICSGHVINPCTRLCRGRVVFGSSAECSVPGCPPLLPIGSSKAGRYLTTAHMISHGANLVNHWLEAGRMICKACADWLVFRARGPFSLVG
jgi:hypothetical protein